MNRISYEKCICFIFLVILVILSCFGFPIDNAPMSTDLSKRYFHTSNFYPSSDIKMFNLDTSPDADPFPPLRHRRLRPRKISSRTPKIPAGHIEALVIDAPIPTPNPLSLTATDSLNTRRQRSSSRRNSRSQECVEEHFSGKAYKADIVLSARAQSNENVSVKKNRPTYTVTFKIVKKYKNLTPYTFREFISVTFVNGTENCARHNRRKRNLVKADIKKTMEYILFLNASSSTVVYPVSAPELFVRGRNKGMKDILKKVCNPNFQPKPLRVHLRVNKWHRLSNNTREEKKNRLKLTCKVRGLPILHLSWKRNNVTVKRNDAARKYNNMTSVLLIKNPQVEDYGKYECIAKSWNGTTVSDSVEVKKPKTDTIEIRNGTRCGEDKKQLCLNDGECFEEVVFATEFFCRCRDGWKGQRCEEKSLHVGSMYPQTPLYTCKLGLSTKFFC